MGETTLYGIEWEWFIIPIYIDIFLLLTWKNLMYPRAIWWEHDL